MNSSSSWHHTKPTSVRNKPEYIRTPVLYCSSGLSKGYKFLSENFWKTLRGLTATSEIKILHVLLLLLHSLQAKRVCFFPFLSLSVSDAHFTQTCNLPLSLKVTPSGHFWTTFPLSLHLSSNKWWIRIAMLPNPPTCAKLKEQTNTYSKMLVISHCTNHNDLNCNQKNEVQIS